MRKITIKINPFWAVRSNRNTWSKTVQNYHRRMNDVRLLLWNDKEKLIKIFYSWDYEVCFFIQMPKSWSKKKKKEKNHTYHKSKPDLDNLFKSLFDSIFYRTKYDDKNISEIKWMKLRGEVWKIVILYK